jgi:hypothetical protein
MTEALDRFIERVIALFRREWTQDDFTLWS